MYVVQSVSYFFIADIFFRHDLKKCVPPGFRAAIIPMKNSSVFKPFHVSTENFFALAFLES